MKKRTFEDYEKVALILRAASQLLYEAEQTYNRAAFSDEIFRIDKRIQKLKSKTEDAFFSDYPGQASIDIFYGSDKRQLSIEYDTHSIDVKLTGGESHRVKGGGFE